MVQSMWSYLKDNWLGHKASGTGNLLPASLTFLSNVLANQGNKSKYELYKEQAQLYLDSAKDNAELIRSQGEIALRNLEYKNALERGNDLVRVAASGAGLGGSAMDVLIRKEKIRKINETTVKAEYTNQMMLEKIHGLRQARQAYGTMASEAERDKWAIWASAIKGVETYMQLSTRDAKTEATIEATAEAIAEKSAIRMKETSAAYLGAGNTATLISNETNTPTNNIKIN